MALSRLAKRNKAKIKKLDKLLEKYEDDLELERERIENYKKRFETGAITRADYQGEKLKTSYKLRELNGAMNRLRKQRLNLERAIREEDEERAEDDFHDAYVDREEEREAEKEARRVERESRKEKEERKARKAKKGQTKKVKKLSPEEKKATTFAKGFVSAYRKGAKAAKSKKAKSLDLVANYPFSVSLVAQGSEYLMVFSEPKADSLSVQLLKEEEFDLSKLGEVFRTCFVQVGDWSEGVGASAGDQLLKKDLS